MAAKDEIKLTIFRLIQERGYSKTTYQAIAEMSGYEKTLVQYHFPQKNLFMILYIDFLVSVVLDYLRENDMGVRENALTFILSSKIYSRLLLHEDLVCNVTATLVRERDMLTKIQDVHEQSAIEILNIDDGNLTDFIFLLRFAQGGHFDIFHRAINGEMPYDIHRTLTLTLQTVSPAISLSQDDVANVMKESQKYEELIDTAVEKIVVSLKSRLGIVMFD